MDHHAGGERPLFRSLWGLSRMSRMVEAVLEHDLQKIAEFLDSLTAGRQSLWQPRLAAASRRIVFSGSSSRRHCFRARCGYIRAPCNEGLEGRKPSAGLGPRRRNLDHICFRPGNPCRAALWAVYLRTADTLLADLCYRVFSSHPAAAQKGEAA